MAALGNKSDYLEKQCLNWLKGTTFAAAPANTYVALFTAAPSDTGGGTEVSGGSYARVAIASSGWSSISGGGTNPNQISNSAAITFTTPTANWGTVVAIGLFDASSGGDLLYWNTITNVTINSGNSVSFAANALVITED